MTAVQQNFKKDGLLVKLTAGNPEGALLPVKRVELQVHRAGKSQRNPDEDAVSQWCWKRSLCGNIPKGKTEAQVTVEENSF